MADSSSASDGTTPQVDFYHLHSDTQRKLHLFCCRLVDKARQLGHSVCILTGDDREARLIDDLLWSWRDDSFLPHALLDDEPDADAGISITHRLPQGHAADLLVNLSSEVPAALQADESGFSRIAEIINEDPLVKQAGRIRYSYYDKCSYALNYHEIPSG